MAGPIVAQLGSFGFEAHGFGLTDINRSLKTSWAKIKVPGGLDQLQWTGGDGDTTTITGVLFPLEFGGQASLEGLRAAALAGESLHLIQMMGTGVGNVLSEFVIEGIDDKQTFIGPNGIPMKNTYSLSLCQDPAGQATEFKSIEGFF